MKFILCLALSPVVSWSPAVAAPAPLIAQQAQQEQATLPSDDVLSAAWERQSDEDKREITEWFRAESDYMDTTQNKLIKYLLQGLEVDRGTLPEHRPLEPYDPEVHAPKQPIPRVWLKPESAAAQKAKKTFAPDRDPMQRTYAYNWATGDIERLLDERDPEALFENALLGIPPKTDLAEALLIKRLDDGSLRNVHLAFAHPYTDRNGSVFPGMTLYDAWGSGSEMEMPDVDVLGVVHDLLDEWKKWVAPVPGGAQKKLYDEVGKFWLDAYQHRSLREALAANYLRGKAVPNDAYASMTLAFNAKWEEFSSDPEKVIEELPEPGEPKKWEKYTKDLTSDVAKKKKFRDAGQVRLDYIEYERYLVKAKLVWVMTQYGALKSE